MSLLSAANKQAKRSVQMRFFQPDQLYGEFNQRTWLAWLISLPLCVCLGAGANYAWHAMHVTPRIKEISVPQETVLPYRWIQQDYALVTEPLPDVAPDQSADNALAADTSDTPARAVKPAANSDVDDATDASSPRTRPDTGLTLQQRLMQAVQDTQAGGSSAASPASSGDTASGVGTAATAVTDLPPRIAQQIPPLRYGAHVYSSQPSKRVININDHNYHEGDEVAPGITLLEIQPRASIFRVGGQSFSVKALTDWTGY
jgi:general secretion pathway protein B